MANDNVDYYELLGVERDASGDQIKRAYYKLARKYHPDTNSDPESQSKFKTINDAYHVLKDPELRSKYDKYGIDGLDKEVFFDFSEEDFNEFLDIANLSEEDFLNEEKEKKKAKKLEKKEARKKQKEEQKKKKEEKKQKSKKDKQYADVDLTDVDVGFTPVPEQEPSFYTDQSSYNSNEEVDADYSNVNDLGDVNVVFDSPSSSDYPQSEDSSYSDYYQGYSQSPEYSDVVSDQEQYQNLNQNEQSSFDNSYESWQADDGYAQQGTEFAADNLDSQENFNNSDLNDDLGQVDYGYDGSSSVQQPESFSVESPSPVENDNLNFSGLTSDGNESDSSRTVASNYDNISNMNENPEYVSEENVSYSKNIEDVKDGDLSFTKSVNFSENVVDKNNVDSIRDEKNESTVSVNKEDMIAQREKSLPNFDFDKIIEHLNKEAQKNKELLSEMQKNSKNKDLQKINDFYSRPDVFSVQNTSEISEISSKQQIKGSKIKSLILRSDDVEEPTDILALELFNKDDQKNLTKQIVTQQIRDYYDNLFAELSKEKIQDQSISAKIERTKQISDVELNEDLDIYIKIKIPQIFAFSKNTFKKIIYQRRITCYGCAEFESSDNCKKCNGKGILIETVKLQVEIPIFAEDSYDLLYRGFGDVNETNDQCGDLHIIFEIIKSQYFRALKNGDVETAAMIPPIIGYLGGIVKVPTLDGLKKVRVDAGTQVNDVIVVEGMGIPEHVDITTKEKIPAGRLLITVIYPKTDSNLLSKVDLKKTTLKELIEFYKSIVDTYNSGVVAELSYISKFKNNEDKKNEKSKTKQKTSKKKKTNAKSKKK